MTRIDSSICRDPFPSEDEIFQKATSHAYLINELMRSAEIYAMTVNKALSCTKEGQIVSLNNGVQPFIVTIYGPTGSGKSQFIRNMISSKMIEPVPETIFFITPEVGTLTTEEKLAWEAQCAEGIYNAKQEPITQRLTPKLVTMNFREATSDTNINIDNPGNVFVKAASQGPICVIMDECMNMLGTSHSISSFFHALPSKICGRFPKCTGYSVIVVLHNMNPRHDRGNIKDLKIQSKCHIISPQLESSQISRFIKNYAFGFPPALVPVLKDIVNHARLNSKYSWLIYNNVPTCESFRWSYYSPDEQLRPIFMDLQTLFYQSCQEIRRIFRKRTYSQLQYIRRLNNDLLF